MQDTTTPKKQKSSSDQSNKTGDNNQPVARRNGFDAVSEIVSALKHQQVRSPLNPDNCCNSGNKGFRTYKTKLPEINSADIVPGILVYRPTTNPISVHEVKSEPYTSEYGSRRVDVITHSFEPCDTKSKTTVSRDNSLFLSDIVDKMTFLKPQVFQQTLAHIPNQ